MQAGAGCAHSVEARPSAQCLEDAGETPAVPGARRSYPEFYPRTQGSRYPPKALSGDGGILSPFLLVRILQKSAQLTILFVRI